MKKRIRKIFLVLPEFPPAIGGMQTHAYYLACHLSESYDITTAAYVPEDGEELQLMRRIDSSLPFPVHRCMSRIGYWHNIKTLTRLIEDFSPDIIYSSTVFYGILEHMTGIPVICRSVGNDVMRPWIAYPFRFGSRLVSTRLVEQVLYRQFKKIEKPEWLDRILIDQRTRIMQLSAKRARCILANSRFTSGLLSEIGVPNARIRVIVGGVDAHRFASPPKKMRSHYRRMLALPEDRYIIMTACRLVIKKGIDTLIDSFELLRLSMPDAHLVIIGNGSHFNKYRSLCAERSLDDSITFTGSVPHEAIHPYYWSADLFVLASRVCANPATGRKDAETMGRVLCEANAAGVPVIAADSGGIPSVIRHGVNGLLFRSDDAQDLLSKIKSVRYTRGLARRLVKNGKLMAHRTFDWQVILKKHVQTFREMMRGRSDR